MLKCSLQRCDPDLLTTELVDGWVLGTSPRMTPEMEARLRVLAGVSPEGCQKPRERGRRNAASYCFIGQPVGARARCSASAEGATTSSAAFGPTRAQHVAGHCVVRDRGRLRSEVWMRSAAARRASVRAVASRAQPRSPAPESEVSEPHDDAANGATPPQPGTVPAPRQTLKLAASLGRAGMGGV